MEKNKCAHVNYNWSHLLNKGICLDCMAELHERPLYVAKPKLSEAVLDKYEGNSIYGDLEKYRGNVYYHDDVLKAMEEFAKLYRKELLAIQRLNCLQACAVDAGDNGSYIFSREAILNAPEPEIVESPQEKPEKESVVCDICDNNKVPQYKMCDAHWQEYMDWTKSRS